MYLKDFGTYEIRPLQKDKYYMTYISYISYNIYGEGSNSELNGRVLVTRGWEAGKIRNC